MVPQDFPPVVDVGAAVTQDWDDLAGGAVERAGDGLSDAWDSVFG